MVSTVTDVEKALTAARELEEYWRNEGWQSLQLEEEVMSNEVLDVYPLVSPDVKVQVTIVLPNKIYSVPLQDVSSINPNECLVISSNDLYFDWEQKVEANLGLLFQESTLADSKGNWSVFRYLGSDSHIRVVKVKATV